MLGEIEETRHLLGAGVGVARVGEAGGGVTEFVEEGVDHGIDG